MKRLTLAFLFSSFLLHVCAQNASGLWQGQWASPEGYVFNFVMDIDQHADNSIEGFINWQFESAPENDWYYKNKKGKEAVEYIRGTISGNLVAVEGYKSDDPYLIISLDKYQFTFDEGFSFFKGITGNHGTWKGRMDAVRINLP
ncbi:MAG: hypothetical protein MH137_04695 [Flavobacteriales bacterium]|nr:hypothetical protein [Flavobacteriales bacterium]